MVQPAMHSPSSYNSCHSVLQAWTLSRHSACCWKASGCLVKRRRLPVYWRPSALSTTNSALTSSTTLTWCMSSRTPSSCSTPTSTTIRQAAVPQLSVLRSLQADASHCPAGCAGIHIMSCIRQANLMVATFFCTRKASITTALLFCSATKRKHPSHSCKPCILTTTSHAAA